MEIAGRRALIVGAGIAGPIAALIFSALESRWKSRRHGAKLITNPIQVWFRDLMMPLFLKRAANPVALDWFYAYKVGWNTLMTVHTVEN